MSTLSSIVGQKVVCIFANFPDAVYDHFDQVPVENRVYVVGEIYWGPEHVTQRLIPSVRLIGFPPIARKQSGFGLWRFRLLAEEKILRSRKLQQELPQHATGLPNNP